ncbi:DUF4303 domain-containing protein [Metasolibacillus meyeri]|uniref:DUF4303 domain-containing protein n=1 Tax=Metasolibacillus meyeri TaxID=1071052 RepID=UPI000D30DBAB|nr:DUF4303 domain-containing protein [Metasolibacillus meyeri]
MKQKIKLAVHEAYTAMYNALKDEQIYAAVLVTDSDCGSLYLTLGTEKSLIQIGESYEDNPEDYRFLKDEFLHEDDTDLLQKVSRELLDRALTADEQFSIHKASIHKVMSDTMYELKQEGVIDEQIFTFISVTDDADDERLEISSAKRCNPNHPLLPAFLRNWQR